MKTRWNDCFCLVLTRVFCIRHQHKIYFFVIVVWFLTSSVLEIYTHEYQPKVVAQPIPSPDSTTDICRHDSPSHRQRQIDIHRMTSPYDTVHSPCIFLFRDKSCEIDCCWNNTFCCFQYYFLWTILMCTDGVKYTGIQST